MDTFARPKVVNSAHFSTEQFPEIIGFCERDNTTHIVNNAQESYQYKLQGKLIYSVKRHGSRWEIIEYDNDHVVKVSAGDKLALVLVHALTFQPTDRSRQENRVNILIPVHIENRDKALAIMYYLGGYPTSLLEVTPELALIKEKFIDPQIVFLAYSFVPVD
jgi:hypothetical protein